MSFIAILQRIRDKAKKSGIRLLPPISETEIATFERTNGIELPEEYRLFLIHVGNGGSGPPAYGLCGLGKTPSDFHGSQLDYSRTFPFTKSWVWEDGDASAKGGKSDLQNGILILGSDGCGQYWILVVNGPDRGKVWILTDVGISPLTPGMTFLEWYEAWLDGKRDWWN